MKTVFLALSVLAILTFAVVPSSALVGTPDNVPGYDVLVPFFLVSMTGHGNQDTIITLTEVCKSAVNFHYKVYDKTGIEFFDSTILLTACDVGSISASTVLELMTAATKAALEIDLDGDGTNDHYCGYMVFTNMNSSPKNQVTAMVYQVDLQNGMRAAANIPAREFDGSITDTKLVDSSRHTELFSANALYRAQQYIKQTTPSDAQYLHLMPRYYLMDSGSKNYWFIWTSIACPSLHVNIFNEVEQSISISLPPLSAGLTIINVESYLPLGLHTSYPKGGWARIAMPDGFGAGFDGDREMIAYSYQFKPGQAAGLCGDVNVNGKVDVGDAMFIAQFLAGNRACICAGTSTEYCGTPGSSVFGWSALTPVHKEAGAN